MLDYLINFTGKAAFGKEKANSLIVCTIGHLDGDAMQSFISQNAGTLGASFQRYTEMLLPPSENLPPFVHTL